MKQLKLTGIVLGCLLLTAQTAVTGAFAEEAATAQNAVSVKDGITRITLALAEQPAEEKTGFVYAEDGSASYLLDGEKLTGHFSVETEYLKGDLGGNNVVDADDAADILSISAEAAACGLRPEEVLLAENEQLSTLYQAEQVADINNDGAINAADASDLLIYLSRVGAGETLNPLGCGQFYADENGVLQQGWISTGAETYYAGEDYVLSEGWTVLDGHTYFFSENAAMQTGYMQLQGNTYFLGNDGALLTGWLDSGDTMCYFDTKTGAQAFGVTEISGSLYYFDNSGALQTGGWMTSEDGIRYADESGALLTSFQTIDGAQYYFYADGTMASGISEIDGGLYYFSDDGKQQFGWLELDGTERYFDEITGRLAVGFTEMADGTHYFAEDGQMLTGWQEIAEAQYYFDAEGIMQTGMVTIDDKTYRFKEDGVYSPVKICLDAGHYAKYNHSPVNDAYWESDFTWKIHLYLKEALEGYGIEVITTREDKDTDLGLSKRGYASEGCDLFLSLHSNACGTESIDAPLACCTVTGTADELGQMLADKVAEVMETRQPGKIWKRQGQDGDWYSVLWGATKVGTPAILLEHSYHTNKRATAWLLVDENVKRMAEAEAELLARYYGMIE